MDFKRIEFIEKRKKYYIENKEEILAKQKKRYHVNKEKFRKYYREYQKENRTKRFIWKNIQLWNIHPKHFDEQKMFTFKDKVYIEKTKKEEYYNELAIKAEQKKYWRFN